MTEDQKKQLSDLLKSLRVLLLKDFRHHGGITEECRKCAYEITVEIDNIVKSIKAEDR